MSIDGGIIGKAAAELMEKLEKLDLPDAELLDVFIIAEVDQKGMTCFQWRGSSDRCSVNAGLCAQALEGLTQGEPAFPEDNQS